MNFLFPYPEMHGTDRDLLDSGDVGTLAVALERAGWDGLAFTEHPAPGARWLEAGGHQTLDPFVALAGAATVTDRIKLVTYLAVLPYRNPLLLAKTAASLDRLSKGRFVLGAGVGYLKGEFRALGVDFDDRNARLDEALEVLPLYWSGEPFSFEGTNWSARDVIGRPRPHQDPIPIWLGGNARITLDRVARRCHGWMPLVGPEAMYATTRTPNPGTESEIGATISRLEREAAGRDVKLDFVLSYTDDSIQQPTREVERHQEAFGRLAEAGVTWTVIAHPPAEPARIIDFIEAFGATYTPS